MLTAIIIAFFIGILFGIICGLAPGIHTNLISVFIISSLAFLLSYFSPLSVVTFIVAMSITQVFIDFIPSTYLGAPDEDTVLSILPSHKLLLEGFGHSAIVYSIYGCIIGLLLVLLFSFPLIVFLNNFYSVFQFFMPFILIIISLFIILNIENNRLLAVIVFILSGFLGIVSLNQNISNSLLPLLTGLFGSSSLILSIARKEKIPEQKIQAFNEIKPSKKEFLRTIIASSLASPLCSFLPGLGSSQAAIIGSQSIKKITEKEFLILIGSINIIVMGLSFVTLYAIGKMRTGSAAAISQIISNLSTSDLFIILLMIILSGIISIFLTFFFSKVFAKNINKINYKCLSISILIFLTGIIFYFTGFVGILIYLTSTFLGIYTISKNLPRHILMGCLLIPTTLMYVFP